MEAILSEINEDLAPSLLSGFTITLGDEFQGLLHEPSILTELMWRAWAYLPEVEFRLGIGLGVLNTPLKRGAAIGMDGPAFHQARAAITIAKKRKLLGGVYKGFESDDLVLGGISRILHERRARWSPPQREVALFLREGIPRTDIAHQIEATPQAVAARVRTSGWSVYQEAEQALEVVLARYTTTHEWSL